MRSSTRVPATRLGGGLSKNPAARARQLANLKRSVPGQWGSKKKPDPPAIKGTPTYKQLVAYAREHTVEAMQEIIAIMRNRAYKARDRLMAAEVILSRGWGRPPLFVKVAGDEPQPQHDDDNIDEAAYASEVLRILLEAGAVLPGTQKESEEEPAGPAEE